MEKTSQPVRYCPGTTLSLLAHENINAGNASLPPVVLHPLDGRYASQTAPLIDYLSESALNRARVMVETHWLLYLAENQVLPGIGVFSDEEISYVKSAYEDFSADSLAQIARFEAETRHDVKAIEYFLADHLERAEKALGHPTQLTKLRPAVHIFCTSEDINNLAYALSIRGAIEDVWLPAAWEYVHTLESGAHTYADISMLSRTHGQHATPTTVGKELAVMAFRMKQQVKAIEKTQYWGKFNGATGTFGAHVEGLPQRDWEKISREFVERFGFTWNPLTTQIEPHDWQVDLYAHISHANRIAHNCATDCWTYISMDYFHQNVAAHGSTGSSTMPHKVNPIRFENAEANFEISCALLDVLCQTLPTSRLQRDLTDSSTQRNIGAALGHSVLALKNITSGLRGISPNPAVLEHDLDHAWEVLAEPIQQAMRVAALSGARGVENPYERLKALTRGKNVTREAMHAFILSLGLSPTLTRRLNALTPQAYTGLATALIAHLDD